jgi:hypothetical protein
MPLGCLVKAGINPNDQKNADRIQAQASVEAVRAGEQQRRSERLTFKDMFDSWMIDGVSRADGKQGTPPDLRERPAPNSPRGSTLSRERLALWHGGCRSSDRPGLIQFRSRRRYSGTSTVKDRHRSQQLARGAPVRGPVCGPADSA